ncbi:Low-density lipoprotein receptor-related protein 3 [Holothuria leucospilota]|uniref:Low-density lipoprotein receptor-related protein 3 n=1 Tax=Holothuria leucospilota TaxID=206669 RepID=A0A9Q1CB82_HOLLE|nr:Low-density lipoprotein receptor-related protein 3 [Holothuria leucospilota]
MKTKATLHQPTSLSQWRRYWGLFLVVSSFFVGSVTATVYMNKHCHGSITSRGDIIKSQDTLYYEPNSKCELILMAGGNSKILLQILDINIVPSGSNCHASYLEVFPVAGSSKNLFLCNRSTVPKLITSKGSYLRLRLVNQGDRVGRGFYGVFATTYPSGKPLSCRYPEYHQCSNGYCISHDLTCDTVNHCGDNSDEDPSLCKEEVYRWMELSKGPISVVEIVFTLIGLGIVITVVVVVVSNCCIDFQRRRRQTYDMSDSVLGETFLRKDSVSYHPAGSRVPIQITRSASIDYSARTATQEDLQYLQKLSESDDVFLDSDLESNSSEARKKISVRREQINQEIEDKVRDINRNNVKQTETDSPSSQKQKGKLPRRVSFDEQVPPNLNNLQEKSESVASKQKTKKKLQRSVSFDDQVSANLNYTEEREESLALLQQPSIQQERRRKPGVIMEHDEGAFAEVFETEI